jgi:transposase
VFVATAPDQLPDEVDTLKAVLIEARAKLSGAEALIAHLQLVIAKMKREMFGPRSERSQRFLDQWELQLEELAAAAGEDEAKAETAVPLERSINGLSPEERLAARRTDIAPLVDGLFDWMKQERAKLSRHNEVAKAMDYMLKRIDVFTRFLADGRICLSNNAAERELRGIALGRKSWLFAGSDRGGERAAVMLTLIQLNDVDPQALLADVLARIADHKITDLAALLPWNWRRLIPIDRAA